jgi:hypothetical protein
LFYSIFGGQEWFDIKSREGCFITPSSAYRDVH